MFKTKFKAGFVPYEIQNGVPVFMFMIPSDPAYGGDQPQIAKGMIDEGENAFNSAIREAEEELGMRIKNIKPFTIKHAATDVRGSVHMTVYMGEVLDRNDFDDPHYETGSVHWLTLEEFIKVGKQSHLHIIQKIHSLLTE